MRNSTITLLDVKRKRQRSEPAALLIELKCFLITIWWHSKHNVTALSHQGFMLLGGRSFLASTWY